MEAKAKRQQGSEEEGVRVPGSDMRASSPVESSR